MTNQSFRSLSNAVHLLEQDILESNLPPEKKQYFALCSGLLTLAKQVILRDIMAGNFEVQNEPFDHVTQALLEVYHQTVAHDSTTCLACARDKKK